MKLRILAFITVISIIISLLAGCAEKEQSPLNESSDESHISETSSEPATKPEPEPEPEPEPDFFTKSGQDFLPTESTIQENLVPTETQHLYSLPLDIEFAENAEIYVNGDYIDLFYWDDGFCGKIVSLKTGETLTELSFSDWETYGSLDDGSVWVASPYQLNIRIVSPDGSTQTVLDEPTMAEERVVQKLSVSDDGKYALVLFENNDYVIFNLETKSNIPSDLKTTDYYWTWRWTNGRFALEGNGKNIVYIHPETGECEKVYLEYDFAGFKNGFYYYNNDQNIVLFTDKADTEYFCMNADNEFLCAVNYGFAVTQQYSDMNIIRVYDLRDSNRIFDIELPYDGFISMADFTDDGNVLITMQMYNSGEGDLEIYIFDLPSAKSGASGEAIETLITTPKALWEEIHSIAEKTEADTGVELYYAAEGNDFIIFDYVGQAEKDVFSVYSTIKTVSEILYLYPEGMLREAYSETHRGLQIYLCGTLYGLGGGSLDTAGGLTTESDGYIVVALDINNSPAFDLPHELSHVFDRRITYMSSVSGNDYMEEWISATPLDDAYTYTYSDYWYNEDYTVDYENDIEDIWFLDGYSRTYPTEDRARIMEHLFNTDNQLLLEMLQHENIQTKARLYCRILRDCFESCNIEGTLYWEQSLN